MGSKGVSAPEATRMAVPPTIVLVLVSVLVTARQARIVRKFREASADQPERARTLADLGVRDTHRVSRFARSGVLVTGDGGRYFLSAEGLARWKRRRSAYVLTALGVLAVVALALLLFLRAG
jgi:hypothetical protein